MHPYVYPEKETRRVRSSRSEASLSGEGKRSAHYAKRASGNMLPRRRPSTGSKELGCRPEDDLTFGPTSLFLFPLFNAQGRAMASIAQRLVTLCATLGEFPHIRFAADGGGRTEGVARTFQVCVFVCVAVSLFSCYRCALLWTACARVARGGCVSCTAVHQIWQMCVSVCVCVRVFGRSITSY